MNAALPVFGTLQGTEDVLIPLFAIFAIFVVPVIALVFIVWMIFGRSRREDPKITAEEVRLMQEIHRGLARMEQRIEALETLTMAPGSRSATRQAGTDSPEGMRNDQP